MKIEKRFEKGHRKTIVTTNIKEIKEFLKYLKKKKILMLVEELLFWKL